MTRDRWGRVTRLVAAVLVESPERSSDVPLSALADGPARDVVAIIRRRHAAGMAANAAALHGLPELERIGPTIALDLLEEVVSQHELPGLVAEARELAVRDRLRRALDDDQPLEVLQSITSAGGAEGVDQWRRLDLAAFLREPPPEPDWILEGFLERGELAWLAGPGKVGKSMTALFLVSAALSGAQLFLGTALAGVDWALYIDGENREATVRRRVHLAGMAPEAVDRIDYRTVRGIDLGSAAGLEQLRRAVTRPGHGLVVLDSLIALHRADEDSASEVRQFVTGLRAVLEPAGVTTIGLAHENRGGTLRGSLDWRNSADSVLELRKDADGWRTLKIGDRRDGPEDVGERRFRFVGDRGRLLLEVPPEGMRRSPGRPPTASQIMVEQIVERLRTDPGLTRAETARRIATQPDHGTFRKAWNEAVQILGAETAGQAGNGVPGRQGSPPLGAAPFCPPASASASNPDESPSGGLC